MNDQAFNQLEESLKHHYRMVFHLQEKYRSKTGREFCPAGIGKYELPDYCSGCYVYSPVYAPEISVYYQVGHGDGPEVHGILVHGQDFSDACYDLLAVRDWEWEITELLEKQAEDARQDTLIEEFEIRQLEMGAAR